MSANFQPDVDGACFAANKRPSRSKTPGPACSKWVIHSKIKFYNADRGFGFITPEAGGKDVFVHATAIGGLQIKEGDRLRFDTEPDKRGKGVQAVNVKRA